MKPPLSTQLEDILDRYRPITRFPHIVEKEEYVAEIIALITQLVDEEVHKAKLNLLLKLKQVPPIDWLDANKSIDQWLEELNSLKGEL